MRAATPGSVISESNCHPFRCGPLLFQHNGHIEQYARIKRRVLAELRDDVFGWLEGTTDSEACFALLISLLDPASIASGTVGAEEMQTAMLGAPLEPQHSCNFGPWATRSSSPARLPRSA